ncbi:WD40-repeat-containing domain protein [Xylogone sp. PMI_703]|nr:WD40-repeat-containing domain protein [Xylogone sp. PMI_703]
MNTSRSKDVELDNVPSDSISALSWSPQTNHLAASSWDNKVYIYDINTSESKKFRIYFELGGPVLDCHWSLDGTIVVGAGADQTARILDLNSGITHQVAIHDKPVRSARFIQIPQSNGPMLVTGSWDGTIKYWDFRQPTPAGTLSLKERIYAMDAKNNLLVVGTADNVANIIQLNDCMTIRMSVESASRHQMRAVACFPDAKGFGVAGIDGRCRLKYIHPKDEKNDFTFRCHREPLGKLTSVYSVNAISFHPIYTRTFSTAGSDGKFHYWDGASHNRIKAFPNVGGSITATGFNKDGSLFAYAVGYDWSKGAEGNKPECPTNIQIHKVSEEAVKPR